MVRTVGIVLCLEAEGTTLGIVDTALSGKGAIEEVSGIELNTGLVCVHLHHDTAVGIVIASTSILLFLSEEFAI